jgi:hypothetical protein
MQPALLLSVLVVGTSPADAPRETIAVFERNYCYDAKTGRRRFVQLIHWNRYGPALHVDFWEMDHDSYVLLALHDAPEVRYRLLRWRGGQVRMFDVERVMETHTSIDPEVADRRLLPVALRRGLAGGP